MSSPDPLSELRDLHLPAAVSPWPPAPGWWILLAFSVMLMVAIGYFLAHTLDSRKYRRKALAEHRKICSLEGDKERIQKDREFKEIGIQKEDKRIQKGRPFKKRKDLSQGWLMTFTDMLMLLVVMLYIDIFLILKSLRLV